MEQNKIIVSHDKGKNLAESDREFIRSAQSGEGAIEIKSAEQLMALANAAHERFQAYRVAINPLMNEKRATMIRDMRVNDDFSWRKIADSCYDEFTHVWAPRSNQLAGMALCEAAAEFFNEHYMNAPWN